MDRLASVFTVPFVVKKKFFLELMYKICNVNIFILPLLLHYDVSFDDFKTYLTVSDYVFYDA